MLPGALLGCTPAASSSDTTSMALGLAGLFAGAAALVFGFFFGEGWATDFFFLLLSNASSSSAGTKSAS
jgi:hypothetical protein